MHTAYWPRWALELARRAPRVQVVRGDTGSGCRSRCSRPRRLLLQHKQRFLEVPGRGGDRGDGRRGGGGDGSGDLGDGSGGTRVRGA